MDKLKLQTPNVVDENILKIGELFPNCVVESKDDEGNIKKSIDFDILKQELSDSVVDGMKERYQLNWPGKKEALWTANTPIEKTLRPCREESADFDKTRNLFIEGDNLDVLKLLQETYLGKVKMIYIDPPYNKGGDFIYKDNFRRNVKSELEKSGQIDGAGNRLITNTTSNGRFHSDWRSMMYPRLKLARNLLRDNGVIFISIDDNEVNNLRKLCDEIFGEENFISCLHVEMSTTQGMKVAAALQHEIVKNAEYILVYSKNSQIFNFINMLYTGKAWDDHYSIYFDKAKNKKMTLLEHLKQVKNYQNIKAKDIGSYYAQDNEFKEYIHSISDKIYRDNNCDIPLKLTSEQLAKLKSGGFIEYKTSQKEYLLKKTKTGVIRQLLPLTLAIGTTDDFEKHFGIRKIRGNWWQDYYKDMMNINKEGKILFKNGKKPIRLLCDMLKISTLHDDMILDFFSGSSSTAHAVMELNKEDGGNRKYIMVQLPEPCDEKSGAFKEEHKTIADIGKERIRLAGKKIKEEIDRKSKQKNLLEDDKNNADDLDIGFRVLKVDSSNMEDVYHRPDEIIQQKIEGVADNIKPDRTTEDLLFQVLISWGVDLSLPIKKEKLSGIDVFFVDEDALAACFVKDGKVTEELCRKIAEKKPLRVVFRDSGFENDSVKINVEQIFKLESPSTDIKTI